MICCWNCVSVFCLFLFFFFKCERCVGRMNIYLMIENMSEVIIMNVICWVNDCVGFVSSVYGRNVMMVVIILKMIGLRISCVLIIVVLSFFFWLDFIFW